MKHRSIRAVAELSIYVALAFIFGYLENLFPIPMPVPGMKLGFAKVGGKWYYFNKKDGVMKRNCKVGRYIFGADGVCPNYK